MSGGRAKVDLRLTMSTPLRSWMLGLARKVLGWGDGGVVGDGDWKVAMIYSGYMDKYICIL